jgi:hypothetical protein
MTSTNEVPVVSFGVGETIWSVAAVVGRDDAEEADDDEHPAATRSRAMVARVRKRDPATRPRSDTGRA